MQYFVHIHPLSLLRSSQKFRGNGYEIRSELVICTMIKLHWLISQELYYYTRISDKQIQLQISFKFSDLICFSNWHSSYKMSYIGIHFLEQFCTSMLKKVSQVVILLISRWLQNSSRMWVTLFRIHTFEKSRWLQDFRKMWIKFWQEFWSGDQMKSSIVLIGG